MCSSLRSELLDQDPAGSCLRSEYFVGERQCCSLRLEIRDCACQVRSERRLKVRYDWVAISQIIRNAYGCESNEHQYHYQAECSFSVEQRLCSRLLRNVFAQRYSDGAGKWCCARCGELEWCCDFDHGDIGHTVVGNLSASESCDIDDGQVRVDIEDAEPETREKCRWKRQESEHGGGGGECLVSVDAGACRDEIVVAVSIGCL